MTTDAIAIEGSVKIFSFLIKKNTFNNTYLKWYICNMITVYQSNYIVLQLLNYQ